MASDKRSADGRVSEKAPKRCPQCGSLEWAKMGRECWDKKTRHPWHDPWADRIEKCICGLPESDPCHDAGHCFSGVVGAHQFTSVSPRSAYSENGGASE